MVSVSIGCAGEGLCPGLEGTRQAEGFLQKLCWEALLAQPSCAPFPGAKHNFLLALAVVLGVLPALPWSVPRSPEMQKFLTKAHKAKLPHLPTLTAPLEAATLVLNTGQMQKTLFCVAFCELKARRQGVPGVTLSKQK